MSEDQLNEYLDMDLINQAEEILTTDTDILEVDDNYFDNLFDDESVFEENNTIIDDSTNENDKNITYDSFYEIMYA